MNKTLKNTYIEFHILQSFPVSCLNRDDVGAPKSAIIGGVERARVSSQCWKRQVRLALQDLGVKLGIRTKKVAELLQTACQAQGATPETAEKCAQVIAETLASDTLLFITDSEATAMAEFAKTKEFNSDKLKEKSTVNELTRYIKKTFNPAVNGLDIALFGRMVAKAADMNIEAAASFSHAVSTHKVASELDFFTALDDYPNNEEMQEQGAAHMGSLEFNSATYYRYISLNLGQLAQTLLSTDEQGVPELQSAIEAFTKALFIAIPAARQNTQSAASPWEYARVLVRRGQRLQIPFETPVKANKEHGGYLQPSINVLQTYLQQKETQFGSLFGKLGDYEWGLKDQYSIDDLINDLKTHVE